MDAFIQLIYAGPQQLVPVATGIVLFILLAGLGALVTGRDRMTEANVLLGWAVVSALFTAVGSFFEAPFGYLSLVVLVLSLAGIAKTFIQRTPLFTPGTWRVLVLSLPVLLIAGAMQPSQWDEFSHWLPAANYLWMFDGFPNSVRPYTGPDMFVAYPYGWPLLSYLSARIAGEILTNIGGVLNFLLLLSFAGFALRSAVQMIGKTHSEVLTWPAAALTVLFATAFNPTFIQKIVFTAYSDVSTAVAVGAALLIGIHYLDALAKRTDTSALSLAWQLALVLSVLINLRQTNLVFVVLLIIAFTLVALRDKTIPLQRFVRHFPLVILPALVVYLIWRHYVAVEFGGLVSGGEAGFRPFSDWNISEIPLILQQMAKVALKKIGYFGPMIAAVYFALRGVFRMNSTYDRVAVLCALVFVGQNAFLLLTYVAHFGARNALNVVSFWRYNTHVGMVALLFMIFSALYLLMHFRHSLDVPKKLKGFALILVLVLPLGFAHKLRFDLEPPKPHYTLVAKQLVGAIPDEATLYLMDPAGSGEAGVITRYFLNRHAVPWMSRSHYDGQKSVSSFVSRVGPKDYLLVHSVVPELAAEIRMSLDGRQSHLLKRRDGEWQIVRSWNKPENHWW